MIIQPCPNFYTSNNNVFRRQKYQLRDNNKFTFDHLKYAVTLKACFVTQNILYKFAEVRTCIRNIDILLRILIGNKHPQINLKSL